MPDARAHAGTCAQGADAAAHEAASASSTSDESDTCLDDSSLAGYCPCQDDATHTRESSTTYCCCKTCSAWTYVQSPVILFCEHGLLVCLNIAVHA